MSYKTLAKLRERVFDTLGAYIAAEDETVICDGDRELLQKRLPDALNGALCRMYESLDVGRKTSLRKLYKRQVVAKPDIKNIYDGCVFNTDRTDIGFYFSFFGEGSIVVACGENEPVTIALEGDGGFSEYRTFVNLDAAGEVRLTASGTIDMKEIVVYSDDGLLPVQALTSDSEECFMLPDDFGSFVSAECEFGRIDTSLVRTLEGYGYVPAFACRGAELVKTEYKALPVCITPETDDGFVFELSSLAFEALVCLTAAELCRDREAETYTRLVYKYNDLANALTRRYENGRRNGFYISAGLRRW